MTNDADSIKDRILKVFEIYPRISPSMLQIGIGPQIRAREWRPVLNSLILEGIVELDELVSLTTTDREQVYRILHLAQA